MGAIGSAIDLVFKMKAEGADSAVAEINKVPKAIKGADDAVKDVATTSDKGSSSVGKLSSAFESLSPLATHAGTALGVVAAGTVAVVYGFTQIISAASKAGAAIYGATIQTGLSAQTLTTLGFNAQLAGQSIEQVLDPVKEFTRLIGEAGTGSAEAAEKLKRLGLDPVVAAQDLDKALTQTLKKIGELPAGVTKANLAMDAFGEQGVVVLRMLDRFGGDLDKAREEAERLGITLSNDAAKGAAEFDRALITTQAQLTALTHQFGREFLPIIGSGLQQISGWLAANKGEISSWGQNFSDTIRGVVEAVRFLQGAIKGAEDTFAGFFGSTLRGAIGWAAQIILTVLDPVGSAIAKIIEGFRQIGAEKRKAEGLAEGSAGIERTVFGDASGSATGGVGGGGKVGTGGAGRGGGGRARGVGGGGRVSVAKEETAQEKEDKAVEAQEKLDKRLLDQAESEMNERLALNEQELASKLKTEDEYRDYIALNRRAQLMFEVELLQSRLAMIKLNGEARLEIEAQIAQLESEIRVNATNEITASLETQEKILQKISERYEQIRADTEAANRADLDAKAEGQRIGLEAAVKDAKNAKDKRAAIENLFAFESQERERLESQRLADIENERQRDLAKLTDLEKQNGLEKEINDRARAKEQAAQSEADTAEIKAARKKNEELAKVAQESKRAYKQLFEDLKNDESIQGFGGAIASIGDQLVQIMERMGQATGNAIAQWALYGGSVGKALKQALAAELAYLAGWATVQALRATAWGFLMLAMQKYDSAANAFIAAGVFAALAGGSALAARGLSGGGKSTQNQAYDFRANTIDSNNSSQAAGNTTQMLSESRTQRQDQRITLEVTSRDSHIVRVVGDNLNQRGDLFPVVVRLVEQN